MITLIYRVNVHHGVKNQDSTSRKSKSDKFSFPRRWQSPDVWYSQQHNIIVENWFRSERDVPYYSLRAISGLENTRVVVELF